METGQCFSHSYGWSGAFLVRLTGWSIKSVSGGTQNWATGAGNSCGTEAEIGLLKKRMSDKSGEANFKRALKVQDVILLATDKYPGTGWTCGTGLDAAQQRLCGSTGLSSEMLKRADNFQFLFSLFYATGKQHIFSSVPQWMQVHIFSFCMGKPILESIHFRWVTSQKAGAASAISHLDSDLYHKNRHDLFKCQGQVITYNRMTKVLHQDL